MSPSFSAPTVSPASRAPQPAGERWQHFVRTHDVDEHARQNPGWSFDYNQLSSGRFSGTIHHVQLPGLRLMHEFSSCAVRQNGEIGPGLWGLGLPVDFAGHANFCGHALSSDSLLGGSVDAVDISSAANFAHIAMIVDASVLDATFDSMYGCRMPRPRLGKLVTELAPEVAARIRSTHLEALRVVMMQPSLLEDERASQLLRDDLLLSWISALPFEVDESDAGSAASRKQLVDRACELMMARLDVSILELCSALNTGRRKLEYCFKETFGMSPAKYQRAVRLNQARRDLKRESMEAASVYDIASRWGFWHHGEFSAFYKQLFGELPSTTLKASAA